MAGLPSGWEADYDGKRWFYIYKPSGHVQYHFPSEGDEFPDFIDVSCPAPALAPEERLESQQQVKRSGGARGVLDAAPGTDGRAARARPVSAVWEEEEANGPEEEVFRPESLMFLGPGTYNDVSPLGEEEEEEAAAKRLVVGHEGAAAKDETQSVPSRRDATQAPSPGLSGRSPNMDFVISETASPALSRLSVDAAVVVPAELPAPDPQDNADPVGRIPEMATEDMARAYIEIHPEPVEIMDNTVSAPVETAAPDGWVELPGQTRPAATEQTDAQSKREEEETPAREEEETPAPEEEVEDKVATEVKYKPFKQGPVHQSTTFPKESNAHGASLSTSGICGDQEFMAQPSELVKCPSVLRPARGRALSQPSTVASRGSSVSSMSAATPLAGDSAQSSVKPAPRLSDTHQEHETARQGPPSHPRVLQTGPSPAPQDAEIPSVSMNRPRSGSATTRKAVPTSSGNPAIATIKPNDPPQNRRHSSFNPPHAFEPRPVSESSLPSVSTPEGIRRGSSGVSLTQTASTTASFTPSPPSLTPGSGGQTALSPAINRSPQGSAQSSQASNSQRGSYFSAVHAESHSHPDRDVVQRSQSPRQVSPPVRMPSPQDVSRPHRMSMQASPGSGNQLSSIMEREETRLHMFQHAAVGNHQSMNAEPSQSQPAKAQGQTHQPLVPYPVTPKVQSARPANEVLGFHSQHIESTERFGQSAVPHTEDDGAPSLQAQQPPSHPQSMAVPETANAAREREKKWTKWFRGSRTSLPAQSHVPPSGHPHAPPSGWQGNSAPIEPQPTQGPDGRSVPWSPGQVSATAFRTQQRQSLPHAQITGAALRHGASAGPNTLHKPHPGHGPAVVPASQPHSVPQQRYQPAYHDSAPRQDGPFVLAGGQHQAGRQGFGRAEDQTSDEFPEYGTAVDL